MSDSFEQGVLAEIEALREHVRLREERKQRDQRGRDATILDLPTIDVTTLDLPEIRALISQRYENGRLRNRLAAAERRIAELEQVLGRT